MHFSFVNIQHSVNLVSIEVADGKNLTPPVLRCDAPAGAVDETGGGNSPTMSAAVARTSSTRDIAVNTVVLTSAVAAAAPGEC